MAKKAQGLKRLDSEEMSYVFLKHSLQSWYHTETPRHFVDVNVTLTCIVSTLFSPHTFAILSYYTPGSFLQTPDFSFSEEYGGLESKKKKRIPRAFQQVTTV